MADAEPFEVKASAPGQGATGQAFRSRKVIVRLGDEVHDETHGLNDAQQDYASRNAVVATPTYAYDDNTMIGVLATIADDADDHFDRPENHHQLRATANVVGTLLETLAPA